MILRLYSYYFSKQADLMLSVVDGINLMMKMNGYSQSNFC